MNATFFRPCHCIHVFSSCSSINQSPSGGELEERLECPSYNASRRRIFCAPVCPGTLLPSAEKHAIAGRATACQCCRIGFDVCCGGYSSPTGSPMGAAPVR